ncbi:2-oxoglutarate dehydrogenase, E2 component, dihydrolipoamide succinyltransferase [Georgenia yuyongxinii]|uniref:Dihydrolipoamide acetyltransferase component of pyruvate dehydrogenase complex n=1 Tax=Georgenia yuyongxinii TaxID=2589797 RepID=A0A5B8C2F1_9MICO|nr:2-oxoglutarate dehydrogenase, E2 component, dihydrolipoamide succinyltransferase [Georgenia yuyongxinii]QDC24839.1 2-oxoglutarate dehydrogenase, E2 component, dihydrolipoamide succinyltransferase [Georgenia yuyongxinii]
MSESVKMPALGESVTEGTVTRWLKAVGESVEVDEPLLEVSTDKVDTEVPSPVAGVVEKILVEEDETVEVGAELVVIGDGTGGGESAPAEDSAPAETSPAASEAPAAEEVEAAQPVSAEAAPAEEAKAQATQNAPTGGSAPAGEAVKMPALGESVTEGTVTRWLKAEGETVEVDEPLLEVSTDKVDTEVPSPVAGTVLKILVQEDETVEVGADLVIVGQAGAAAPAAEAPKEAPAEAPAPEAPKAEAPKAEAPKAEAPKAEAPKAEAPKAEAPKTAQPARAEAAPAAAGTAYITPLVRKLAVEKGIDLSSLTGTGVGGRIRKQDVEAAAEKAAAEKAAAQAAPAAAPAGAPAKQPTQVEVSPLRGTTEKMSRLRKVIAKRMRESLDTSTQLTSVMEVDVTRVATLRARAKNAFQTAEGTKLTFLPFFVKAATEALKSHPKLNATIDGDNVIYHGAEHMGIAVDTPRGLLVPVIKDAGDLTIGGIAKKINDLAARTRDSKVTPDELSGSTFTITNTGSAGLLIDTPIINQPEVAIMGVGTIVKRPAVVKDAEGNETIGIRSIIYLSLTYDHRLVDGADAGRFLQTVKARLEEGAFEAEVGL